jgi:predicted  nucleic acid-binding Zn-ribbon protein
VLLEEKTSNNDYYSKIEENIEKYKKQISEFDNGIKALYLDKVKNIIDDNQFIEYSKNFHDDKNKLEKLIAGLQEEVERHNNKLQSNSDKKQIVEEYAEITELDRDIVDKLIDYIYVGKRDPETKELPVEICWNF